MDERAAPWLVVGIFLLTAWVIGPSHLPVAALTLFGGFIAGAMFQAVEGRTPEAPPPPTRRRTRSRRAATNEELHVDEAKVSAHDDYLIATKAMTERSRPMRVRAQKGDAFARGYVAALDHFALEVLGALSRREDGASPGYPLPEHVAEEGGEVSMTTGLRPPRAKELK